jgi:transcription initiation factor IIF auxiliary subunit
MKITKSRLKEIIREEIETINEVDFDKIKLPSVVNRFLNKFVQSMKDANLNRMKRAAILYKVIEASGMSVQQLMADIQKIKKELK